MHAVAHALLRGEPVRPRLWRSLWSELEARTLERTDAEVVLSRLSSRLPDQATFSALVASLRPERVPRIRGRTAPVRVNIVGTGGGPGTFNISTGAAIVAASTGVAVVKTGSSAYTSRLGSIDLVRRLGLTLTGSASETDEAVQRLGIAFTGGYVYPPEFGRLARLLFPAPLRSHGRLLNLLGPLVADVDVDAQVSGVSSGAALRLLRRAADDTSPRPIWWVENDLGTDELISFGPNRLHRSGPGGRSGFDDCRVPDRYPAAPGSLAELAPCADPDDAVPDFEAALAGRRHRAATETLALNAAAVAVAGGYGDWSGAYARSLAAVQDGAALDLLHRLRADAGRDHHGRPLVGMSRRG